MANWYGLKSIDSNNYLSKEVTCDVSRIQEQGYTFLQDDAEDAAPNGILPFNQIMNYVSAVSPAVSKNVILYEGDVVYTIGNKVAYPVEQDPDGVRFVNLNKPISAPDLICNPALPYCSDDGTEIMDLDTSDDENAKTCNELYGSFVNQYIPNPDNSDIVCKFVCVDGKLESTDCKNIPDCEEGIFNEKYECVVADVEDEDDGAILTPEILYIIGFFLIVIMIMIVIKIRKGGVRK